MDAKEIQMRIERVKTDIEKEVHDRLPRKVGITAVNHFRQNFRDAGWRDNGLHPWKKTLRQQGGGPDAKYTPLSSRRDTSCAPSSTSRLHRGSSPSQTPCHTRPVEKRFLGINSHK